ncbi:MAG: DUF4347 domain-containing protein, partial [Planctomycetota bacterium]
MSENKSPRSFDFALLEDRILLSGEGLESPDAFANADLEYIDALMEDAAPSGIATDTSTETTKLSDSQTAVLEQVSEGEAKTTPTLIDERIEVIFVDHSVEDAETLLQDLRAGSDHSTRWEVISIASEEDGVTKITETLSNFAGVDAIHLISHGDGSGLTLGNVRLDESTLAGYAGELATWQSALDSDADLLIYGCDLASTQSGQDLIESLAALCDCDVAASEDLTGHTELGGDWILEYTVGDVQTDVAFGYMAQASWFGILNDTGFVSPTATGEDFNDFTNPTGAFTSDDVRASEATDGDAQDYYDFNFGVPAGVLIDGIQFSVEGYREGFLALPLIELSWDGGASYTNAGEIIPLTQSSDGTNTVGNSTNLWGRTWTADELSNENFRVRIAKPSGGANFHIDHLQARVFYTDTLTVDTTADVVDGTTTSISNLLANRGADGFISLREAIIAANNTAGADVISLGDGIYNLTIAGDAEQAAALGDLDIASDITIIGTGAESTIINGAMADRIFEVTAGSSLTLQNLTIQGGDGDVYQGGAVSVDGSLTATDVVFRDNATGSAQGGAIYSTGITDLERVSIVNNTTDTNAGALAVFGGTTTLTNVTISGNQSFFDGGAIRVNTGGTLDIDHSTIAANTATNGNGGGLFNTGGTINISNSIVADNTSAFGGSDVHGTIVSGGYNIIEDNSNFTGSTGTDILGSDPGLRALAFDVSTGQYVHAITSDSSAYNAAATSSLSTDQRDVARDSNPDIGAFEYDGSPLDITTTASTGGGLSINADGGNDAFLLADVSPFSGEGQVTVEVDFQVTTPATGLTTLLSYATGTNQDELWIGIDSGGEVFFRTSSNGGSGYGSITHAPELLDGNRHTLSVTWESTGGILMFYVDGEQLGLGRNDYQRTTAIDAGGTLVIGQHQTGPGSGFVSSDTFEGTIYSARIFSDLRSAAEIADSYRSDLPYDEAGVLAQWTF